MLARVKVDPHAKNQGQSSNGSSRRAQTNKQTDRQTDATKRIISPASRSIIKCFLSEEKHGVGLQVWHRKFRTYLTV